VPIPFRDEADLDDLGVASFLRIERSERGSTYLGALFSVNARGEPIELVYNALETPHPFLWRPADLRRHAERRLTASLLAAAESTPRLLFCLADEVGGELFSQDLSIDVPIGRVERPAITASGPGNDDDAHDSASRMPVQVFWHPGPPAEASVERALFEQLASRGLLLEPFDRATDGLREVYGARPSDNVSS
jgi:hypothetical protein